MATDFPLVCASDIAPFLRWLRDSDRPIDEALRLAHLPVAPWEEPNRPIPLLGAFAVMRSLSAHEGPDIACRVVSGRGVLELGEIGEAMLAGRTARDALHLLCDAIDRHSSHEQYIVVTGSSGAMIREQIELDVDDETRHIVQQYVAALIRALFPMSGFGGNPFVRVEMTPHPQFGFAHLKNLLGVAPVPTSSGRLSILISNAVLDRPFLPQFRKSNFSEASHQQSRLKGIGFKTSAKLCIETMLEQGKSEPSIRELSALSGLSRRSLQRRLAEEDTSFSALVDEVRRARALEELSRGATPIGSIAADLGYSGQPAFVRAVRRWTGKSPREFRRLATS